MSSLPPFQLIPFPRSKVDDLRAELETHIADAIVNQPRSLQKRIGPSEIGTPCDRCLGHKLAGIPELREVAWKAYIGSAFHDRLATVFTDLNAQYETPRWLVEMQVDVGEIDGQSILGHSDLYDRATATVIDWKLVGPTTLKAVKAKPKPVYVVQGHSYARGFIRRGAPVEQVAIFYLPRNAESMRAGVWWSEPYDEQVCLDALARCDALARAIRIAGWENVRDGLKPLEGCENCHRYPLPDGSRLPMAHHRKDTFTDLLGSAA